jgi:hypothetical protein
MTAVHTSVLIRVAREFDRSAEPESINCNTAAAVTVFVIEYAIIVVERP